jgi:prepilin-type N-terminal cleavage/methylation domain-containing protein
MKIMSRHSNDGYTLIELMIVIIIIGIFANMALLQMGIVFAKARDARRKSNLASIAQALNLYYSEHGTYAVPAGYYGDGTGYFNYDAEGQLSAADYLYQKGYLPNKQFIDPLSPIPPAWGWDYFLTICDSSGGSFQLFATLEFPTSNDVNKELNTTCTNNPYFSSAGYYVNFNNYAYP